MNRDAHVAAGIALALVLVHGDAMARIVAATTAALAATIPDLDLHVRHRALLHSLTALSLSTLAVALLAVTAVTQYKLQLVQGYIAGYTSHILLDMLTIRGVALFYPFSRKYYRLARFNSSSPTINTLVIIASTMLIALTLLPYTIG